MSEWCLTTAGDPYLCDCSDANAPDFPCGATCGPNNPELCATTPTTPPTPSCGPYAGDILATVQALGFTGVNAQCFADVWAAYCDANIAAGLCGTGNTTPLPGTSPLYDCVTRCDQSTDLGPARDRCVQACAPRAPCTGIFGCGLKLPNFGLLIALAIGVIVVVGIQDVRALVPARA